MQQLREHVFENIIQVNGRFYLQRTGIAQVRLPLGCRTLEIPNVIVPDFLNVLVLAAAGLCALDIALQLLLRQLGTNAAG